MAVEFHLGVKITNAQEDSLRLYRLQEPRERHARVHGRDHRVDFEAPLIG